MGPIEYVFITIGIIIGLIGMARGYQRELGNTVIFLLMVAALTILDQRLFLTDELVRIGTSIIGLEKGAANFVAMLVYYLAVIVVAFKSYSGTVFAFEGKQIPAPLGTLVALGVGLVNGYLVAGTLWYYADKFGYPLVEFTSALTPVAQALIKVLPQTVDSPLLWIVPAALLMIIRVWK